ncbi:MAG: AraC family transcriptional regulator [Chitinophagaceae bacterium]
MREITKDTASQILKEQFIPDNVFLYVARGAINFFDGNKTYTFKTGECFIARKNRLAKFTLADSKDGFEPILFCFDEPFLQQFQQKHKIKAPAPSRSSATFIKITQTAWIDDFIRSLKPYYKGVMQLDAAFEDLKYEELLIILLKNQPSLAGIFFDYTIPQKINLEAFMNRNYKFNASIQRFAYLTGRSLSAFKRDFATIFNDTPNHWLIQKRLEEASLLINKKKKPSDIYIDLGFETLSHFSFAFKKQFGLSPTDFANRKLKRSR